MATQYREWVPGLSRLHQSSDQGETQWTDWLRISLGGDGMFWRLDYYTTRRTNPDGTVWIEANADGSHSFNVTTGELRVDDPQLAGGAADAWAQAMRSGSTEDRATAVARAFWAKDAKKNLPELLRILRDEAEPVRVRKSAIESVIRLGGKETLGAVVDLLASSESGRSRRGVRTGRGHGRGAPPWPLSGCWRDDPREALRGAPSRGRRPAPVPGSTTTATAGPLPR